MTEDSWQSEVREVLDSLVLNKDRMMASLAFGLMSLPLNGFVYLAEEDSVKRR